jgi:hypothetical protein
MNTFYSLISPLLLYFLVACSGADSAMDSSNSYHAFEQASTKPAAKTFHDNDWTIISTTENGEHVYWFLAPNIDNASPAMFKKTIPAKDKQEQETVIVSECEAPKPVCDELMKQFKVLSEKYK